mmetsp:Transcript_8058/g.29296  ORF Transcript_8058/g.29296 Transcript_8058/m.29296 type:complete len:730 (+) Transcript_8058:125-2314(+)
MVLMGPMTPREPSVCPLSIDALAAAACQHKESAKWPKIGRELSALTDPPHTARNLRTASCGLSGASTASTHWYGAGASRDRVKVLWRAPGHIDDGVFEADEAAERSTLSYRMTSEKSKVLAGPAFLAGSCKLPPAVPSMSSTAPAPGSLTDRSNRRWLPAHDPYDWSWMGSAPSGRWVVEKGRPRCVEAGLVDGQLQALSRSQRKANQLSRESSLLRLNPDFFAGAHDAPGSRDGGGSASSDDSPLSHSDEGGSEAGEEDQEYVAQLPRSATHVKQRQELSRMAKEMRKKNSGKKVAVDDKKASEPSSPSNRKKNSKKVGMMSEGDDMDIEEFLDKMDAQLQLSEGHNVTKLPRFSHLDALGGAQALAEKIIAQPPGSPNSRMSILSQRRVSRRPVGKSNSRTSLFTKKTVSENLAGSSSCRTPMAAGSHEIGSLHFRGSSGSSRSAAPPGTARSSVQPPGAAGPLKLEPLSAPTWAAHEVGAIVPPEPSSSAAGEEEPVSPSVSALTRWRIAAASAPAPARACQDGGGGDSSGTSSPSRATSVSPRRKTELGKVFMIAAAAVAQIASKEQSAHSEKVAADRHNRDLKSEIRRLKDKLYLSAQTAFGNDVWQQCGIDSDHLKKQQLAQLLGGGLAFGKKKEGGSDDEAEKKEEDDAGNGGGGGGGGDSSGGGGGGSRMRRSSVGRGLAKRGSVKPGAGMGLSPSSRGDPSKRRRSSASAKWRNQKFLTL